MSLTDRNSPKASHRDRPPGDYDGSDSISGIYIFKSDSINFQLNVRKASSSGSNTELLEYKSL